MVDFTPHETRTAAEDHIEKIIEANDCSSFLERGKRSRKLTKEGKEFAAEFFTDEIKEECSGDVYTDVEKMQNRIDDLRNVRDKAGKGSAERVFLTRMIQSCEFAVRGVQKEYIGQELHDEKSSASHIFRHLGFRRSKQDNSLNLESSEAFRYQAVAETLIAARSTIVKNLTQKKGYSEVEAKILLSKYENRLAEGLRSGSRKMGTSKDADSLRKNISGSAQALYELYGIEKDKSGKKFLASRVEQELEKEAEAVEFEKNSETLGEKIIKRIQEVSKINIPQKSRKAFRVATAIAVFSGGAKVLVKKLEAQTAEQPEIPSVEYIEKEIRSDTSSSEIDKYIINPNQTDPVSVEGTGTPNASSREETFEVFSLSKENSVESQTSATPTSQPIEQKPRENKSRETEQPEIVGSKKGEEKQKENEDEDAKSNSKEIIENEEASEDIQTLQNIEPTHSNNKSEISKNEEKEDTKEVVMNKKKSYLQRGDNLKKEESMGERAESTPEADYSEFNEREIITAIKEYFPENPKLAIAIFRHESQLGQYFQNLEGAPSYGIAQIYLPVWRDKIPGKTDEEKISWLKNPNNNLKLAREIYEDSKKRRGNGWLPWDSYRFGYYKKYLPWAGEVIKKSPIEIPADKHHEDSPQSSTSELD